MICPGADHEDGDEWQWAGVMARWIGLLLGSLMLIVTGAGASAAADPEVTVRFNAGSAAEWRQVTTSVRWCPVASADRHLEIDLPKQIVGLPSTMETAAGVSGTIAGRRVSVDLGTDAPDGACATLQLTGTWEGPAPAGDQALDLTVNGQPLRSTVTLRPPGHGSTRTVTLEPLSLSCGSGCTTWLLSMPNGPQEPSLLVFTPGPGQSIVCERLTTELARLVGDQVDRTEPWVLSRTCSPGRAEIRATTTWAGALFRASVPVTGSGPSGTRSAGLSWTAGQRTSSAAAAVAPNSAVARLDSASGNPGNPENPGKDRQSWQSYWSIESDLRGYAWLVVVLAVLGVAGAVAVPRWLGGPDRPGGSRP